MSHLLGARSLSQSTVTSIAAAIAILQGCGGSVQRSSGAGLADATAEGSVGGSSDASSAPDSGAPIPEGGPADSGSTEPDAEPEAAPPQDAAVDAPPPPDCPPDETLCIDSCTNVASDAANCGICGHSCGGGACSSGVCQPWALASSRPAAPLNVALDPKGKYLFWTENGSGGVYQIPIDGGEVTTIKAPDTSGGSWAVATDGTNVYWSDRANGTLGGNTVTGSSTPWSYPSPNGGGAGTYGIAFGGGNLYAADFSSGHVWKVSASAAHGTTGTNDYAAPGPTGLFYEGSDLLSVVYNGTGTSTTSGTVVYENGSAAASAVNNVDSRYVTSDGTNIYWTASDGGQVWTVPLGSLAATPTALSTSESQPWGIATDGKESVYWVNYTNSTIRHATHAGSGWTVTTVAAGNVPTDIRVDTTAIYWADYGGLRIMRLNK